MEVNWGKSASSFEVEQVPLYLEIDRMLFRRIERNAQKVGDPGEKPEWYR